MNRSLRSNRCRAFPPTARHTQRAIDTIKREKAALILRDVYHSDRAAKLVAEKTGARVAVLPHDVGAVPGSESLEGLFDTLCKAFAP